jgi:CTD kinase subunit gamma
MDAFEKRIQFIEILKRLTSSQQSIAKVVQFAVRNAPRCGDDLWDCLIEECDKAGLSSGAISLAETKG